MQTYLAHQPGFKEILQSRAVSWTGTVPPRGRCTPISWADVPTGGHSPRAHLCQSSRMGVTRSAGPSIPGQLLVLPLPFPASLKPLRVLLLASSVHPGVRCAKPLLCNLPRFHLLFAASLSWSSVCSAKQPQEKDANFMGIWRDPSCPGRRLSCKICKIS